MDLTENAAVAVTRCAGAVVVDAEGRLLAVLRRNEPNRGCWSIPGGRIEAGETAAEAARREVREETGLRIEIGVLLAIVHQPYVDGSGRAGVLEIHDFAATAKGGEPVAGDDALDARWLTRAQLSELPLSPGLLAALDGFGVELR